MPYTVEEWKKTHPQDLDNGQELQVVWEYDYGDPEHTSFKYYGKDIDTMVDLLKKEGKEGITMPMVWKQLIIEHHNITDDDDWRNGVKDYDLIDTGNVFSKGGCGDEHNFDPEY